MIMSSMIEWCFLSGDTATKLGGRSECDKCSLKFHASSSAVASSQGRPSDRLKL